MYCRNCRIQLRGKQTVCPYGCAVDAVSVQPEAPAAPEQSKRSRLIGATLLLFVVIVLAAVIPIAGMVHNAELSATTA